MTTELMSVLYIVALFFGLTVGQAVVATVRYGPKYQLGARDEVQEASVLMRRFQRTAANQLEGMLVFIPLIFVAHLTIGSTPATAMAATVYVLSRVAFSIAYIMGIPVIRSLIFGVGLAAIVVIANEILTKAG